MRNKTNGSKTKQSNQRNEAHLAAQKLIIASNNGLN